MSNNNSDKIKILAKNLINYSCEIKSGEKILIETTGNELNLTQALIEETYKAGGTPYITLKRGEVLATLLNEATAEQMKDIAKWESARMKEMDAYIGLRVKDNMFDMADVPGDKMQLYSQLWSHPVHHEIRVKDTKWVVLRYPNDAMAQAAGMPTAKFADFYYNVCNLDYSKMSRAMDGLVNLMNQTDKVHLKGEKLDLRFSIKNISAIKCDGKRNIPDGEVYTAPVKDSVEGEITYNTNSIHEGINYRNIYFRFEKGKIVEAKADGETARINKVLDTDEGARFIGEFAIGVNPLILEPIQDTLFDEKIMGSFHFTPGASYDDAYNGNNSAVHWDLVNIQTPEYGGGEIYFDDQLIRKDGLFVIPELEDLNPENLLK